MENFEFFSECLVLPLITSDLNNIGLTNPTGFKLNMY